MSSISMVEAKLPPGFRFHPRDEELVCDYLMKKVARYESLLLMIEVDLNKCEPWDIPATARVGGKEWYFYSQRDRKYATGQRTNRATASGYWKATGKDKPVLRKGTLVGMRKTLVFYKGRAPRGTKTDWVMHEFRIEGPFGPQISSQKEDWVLCRVSNKSGEVPAKSSLGSCYDDTGSSSLPALSDSYITFGQTQPNNRDEHAQVPCFSIFSPNQINPIFSHFSTNVEPNIPTKTTTMFGGIPELGSFLDPFSCDKKAIKALLNHLTKMGEGSSESYLSEVGLSNMWNHY